MIDEGIVIFMLLKSKGKFEMKRALKQQDLFKIIQEAFAADAVLQGVPLVTYVDSESEGAFVLFEAEQVLNDLFHLNLEVKSFYLGSL